MKMKSIIVTMVALALSLGCFAQDTNELQYVEKQADARNNDIIKLYSKDYAISEKLKVSEKQARVAMAIFKATQNSIFSNEDIEVTFEVNDDDYDPDCKYGYPLNWYKIIIKNKTSQPLFIDKSMCARIPSKGRTRYYDETVPVMANRELKENTILRIDANSTILLSQNKYMENVGYVDFVEDFAFNIAPDVKYKSPEIFKWVNHVSNELCYEYGSLKVGENKSFSEDTTPFRVKYIISYSSSEDFKEYSVMIPQLYISQLIGIESVGKPDLGYITYSTDRWMSKGTKPYPVTFLNEYSSLTIVGAVGLLDVKKNDDVLKKMISDARNYEQNGMHQKSYNTYRKAINGGYPISGKLLAEAALADFNVGYAPNLLSSRQLFFRIPDFSDIEYELIPDYWHIVNIAWDKYLVRNEQYEKEQQSIYSNIIQSLTSINSAISHYNSIHRNNLTSIANLRRTTSTRSTVSSHDDTPEPKEEKGTIRRKCTFCNGEGRVLKKEARYGASGKFKKCDECGEEYETSEVHKHVDCSRCDGKGYREVEY